MDGMHRLPGSSRLPEAATALLASLQQAEAELNQISAKLEEEFAHRCRGNQVNPLSVLTRLNRLRRELPQLHEEVRQVLSAKQEVVDAAKRQLTGNTELLHRLQRRAGILAGGGGGEVEAAFAAALAEHEAKLRVQYAGDYEDQFCRDELQQAYVDSAMV